MKLLERIRLSIVLWFKHGIGLEWTPGTAWYIAGKFMELRAFCREHNIRREGGWLVRYPKDGELSAVEQR